MAGKLWRKVVRTNIEKRIKLAEAMGWHGFYKSVLYGHPCGYEQDKPVESHSFTGNPTGRILPDPFTDANDDYAVLEWMRQGEFVKQKQFELFLHDEPSFYVLGDYARAALKVIE